MNRSLVILAALLTVASIMIAVGVGMYAVAAGVIVGGVLLAAVSTFFLLDVTNTTARNERR